MKHCIHNSTIKAIRLTRWLSSSESALSICAKRLFHLTEWASAFDWLELQSVEPFVICTSSEENSLNIKMGKSVLITCRTLFRLFLSAAIEIDRYEEISNTLSMKKILCKLYKQLQESPFFQKLLKNVILLPFVEFANTTLIYREDENYL